MSAFDDAVVSVVVADYIGVDQGGKFNIIGAGFQLTGLQSTGTSGPQFVLGLAEFPVRHAGHQIGMSLELIDLTDSTSFKMPGTSGKPEALRLEQMFTLERPNASVPGFVVPTDMPARLQMVMGFPNGLPLTPGKQYEWRVHIDGQRRKGWVARFHVVAPMPPPILGGQGGPSDIPHVRLDNSSDDDVVEP